MVIVSLDLEIKPELARAESKVKENLNDVSANASLALDVPQSALPEPFAGWFSARDWHPHAHQLELLAKVSQCRDALLIAPTGGGKTFAGFLPSLIDLAHLALDQRLVQGRQSIHSTSRRSRRLPSISRATLRRQSRRWACPSDLRRAQETRCHRGVPANASRRGYARCVARLLEPDETLLSRVRHHLRPDRAPSSGTGEDRTADDGVFRSDLPRAPPKRTRPHSSARRICRCSNGTHRCRPPQPILATHSRTNQAYCLEPSFAARCARHA